MRRQRHDRHATHGVSRQHGVAHIGRLEYRRQVMRQSLDGQRCRAPRARPVPTLVVEHDTEALLPQPAGDREPDLVTAAPAVGEHHHRRIRTVAREVPEGQLRPVRCPDDGVVRPAHALAPTRAPGPPLRLAITGARPPAACRPPRRRAAASAAPRSKSGPAARRPGAAPPRGGSISGSRGGRGGALSYFPSVWPHAVRATPPARPPGRRAPRPDPELGRPGSGATPINRGRPSPPRAQLIDPGSRGSRVDQCASPGTSRRRRREERGNMSGHSKWATTKYRKGAQDKARAKIFAKCIRLVEVAARDGGGDLEANATLRTAYQKAGRPACRSTPLRRRSSGDRRSRRGALRGDQLRGLRPRRCDDHGRDAE